MSASHNDPQAYARLSKVWEGTKHLPHTSTDPEDHKFDTNLILRDVSLHSASYNPVRQVTFAVNISHFYVNTLRNLHGGAASLIFDLCTSLAVMGLAGGEKDRDADIGDEVTELGRIWLNSGVSRNLSVTYLRPAPIKTRCLVVCEVLHVGRKVASVRGTLRKDGVDGEAGVLCICMHDKVCYASRL